MVTTTPSLSSSGASASSQKESAALLAPYKAPRGKGTSAARDEMPTSCPRRRAFMRGSKVINVATAPVTLVPITRAAS